MAPVCDQLLTKTTLKGNKMHIKKNFEHLNGETVFCSCSVHKSNFISLTLFIQTHILHTIK